MEPSCLAPEPTPFSRMSFCFSCGEDTFKHQRAPPSLHPAARPNGLVPRLPQTRGFTESPCAFARTPWDTGPGLLSPFALPASSLPFPGQLCAVEAGLCPRRRPVPGSLVPRLLVGIVGREARASGQGERGRGMSLPPPFLGTTAAAGICMSLPNRGSCWQARPAPPCSQRGS